MSEQKPQEAPSRKAQKDLDEYYFNELLSKDPEVVARMCIDYNKQLKEAAKLIESQEKEIERKERKIAEKEKIIEELKNSQNPVRKYDGFNKNKSLIDKIRFILERNKLSMTYQEIRDVLLLLNPELNERWGNANKSVTHLLSKACRYGALVKSKIHGNYGYYCYHLPATN